MKNNKLSLIISIIALIGVILLFVFHFSGNKSEKTDKTNVAENSAIVYVNMDSVLTKYDLYNSLSLQLGKKQQDLEKQLQSKMLSLQNRAYQLQQQFSQHLITTQDYQTKAQRLTDEQNQLQQWQQTKAMELQEDQVNLNQRVYDSIINVVKIINKDKTYNLVISNATGGTLLYGDPDWDITAQVTKLLNDRAPLTDSLKVTK